MPDVQNQAKAIFRELFSREETATKLSISLRTVDTLIAQRRLETLRIGRRVLIKAASIDRLLKARYLDLHKNGRENKQLPAEAPQAKPHAVQ